jgi:AraC family L-rhamnose operon regulatory protein RhaS
VFSPEDLKRLTNLLRHCERPAWKATPAIRSVFEKMSKQLEASEPASAETQIKILLNSLLFDLLQMLKSKRIALQPNLTSTRRMVELFLQNLPEHLDHPWSLESMADHCGLGRSRFAHYCEEITNLSPARYLMRCRLEAAQRLLRGSSRPNVTEVALTCGFSSSQYFANAFRQAFGISPSTVAKLPAGFIGTRARPMSRTP